MWKELWCFHHWHKDASMYGVKLIDLKICRVNEQTYYKWVCCKCLTDRLYKFLHDPNDGDSAYRR